MAKNPIDPGCLDFGLKVFSYKLNANGIEFFPFFGTLLGLTRDSKPIEGDDDVDFYVNILHFAHVKSLLNDLGFQVDYKTRPNHTEFFIQAKGLLEGQFVRVDFYFYDGEIDPNFLIERWNFPAQPEKSKNHLRLPKALVFPLRNIDYCGINIPFPKYPEIICEFLYGINWRTPQKKHKDYQMVMLGGRPIRIQQTEGKISLLP